jgi:hypothetical protein
MKPFIKSLKKIGSMVLAIDSKLISSLKQFIAIKILKNNYAL